MHLSAPHLSTWSLTFSTSSSHLSTNDKEENRLNIPLRHNVFKHAVKHTFEPTLAKQNKILSYQTCFSIKETQSQLCGRFAFACYLIGLQRVSGSKLSRISNGYPFSFHAVSLFTLLLSAFCRYVIMVWKGWSQTFHRAQRGNKAGVWDVRSGSTVAVRWLQTAEIDI